MKMRFLKQILVVATLLVAGSAHAQQMNPIVQDNFQRANETPVYGGGNWSLSPASTYPLAVNTDTLQVTTASENSIALWTGISWSPDQYAEIIGTNINTNNSYQWIILRGSTSAATFYSLRIGPVTSQTSAPVKIFKTVNGADDQLSSFTFSGDIENTPIYFQAQGDKLSVVINGTEHVVLDSSITSGVPGVALNTSNISGAFCLCDNLIRYFAAGTMTTANTGLPCGQSGYGTYTAPAANFEGDQAIKQVSISNNVVTFYVSSATKDPVPGETVNVSGVMALDSSFLNDTFVVSSVGTPSGGLTPVVVDLDLPATLPDVPLTTLPYPGLLDAHVQTITSTSVNNGVATIVVANNYVPNESVRLFGTSNGGGALDGVALVTSASPTQFTFAINHGYLSSQAESDAYVEGVIFMSVSSMIEGQASGNLSCVTSNFQNKVTITLPGGKSSSTGTPYTPGTFGSYTYHANFDLPCEFFDCGGEGNTGGEVDISSGGTYTDGPQFDFEIEMAHTKARLPYPSEPVESFTFPLFGSKVVLNYGIYNQVDNCSVIPDYVIAPLSQPFMWGVDGFKIPGKPLANYWLFGLCERIGTSGPWSCVGIYPIYVPATPVRSPHCTSNLPMILIPL